MSSGIKTIEQWVVSSPSDHLRMKQNILVWIAGGQGIFLWHHEVLGVEKKQCLEQPETWAFSLYDAILIP